LLLSRPKNILHNNKIIIRNAKKTASEGVKKRLNVFSWCMALLLLRINNFYNASAIFLCCLALPQQHETQNRNREREKSSHNENDIKMLLDWLFIVSTIIFRLITNGGSNCAVSRNRSVRVEK
jgi:hypothetical protein